MVTLCQICLNIWNRSIIRAKVCNLNIFYWDQLQNLGILEGPRRESRNLLRQPRWNSSNPSNSGTDSAEPLNLCYFLPTYNYFSELFIVEKRIKLLSTVQIWLAFVLSPRKAINNFIFGDELMDIREITEKTDPGNTY